MASGHSMNPLKKRSPNKEGEDTATDHLYVVLQPRLGSCYLLKRSVQGTFSVSE